MKTAAEEAMDKNGASESRNKLEKWLETFSKMKVKMRIEDYVSGQKMREAHNAEYQRRVKEMSEKGGYKPDLLGICAQYF